MAWSSILFLVVTLVLERAALVLSQQAAAVTMSLEPPADNVGDVSSLSYCPTDMATVNVTCTVEGIESPLRIDPRFIIGCDVFYINNETKTTQWGIRLFSKNHTFLYFELPLNATTDGLNISCKSENYKSPNMTLSADDSLCINPTSAIPPSSSVMADADLYSTQSSSVNETMSSSLPTPTVIPGSPDSFPSTATVVAAVVVAISFIIFVGGIACVILAIKCFISKKKARTGGRDPVRYAPEDPEGPADDNHDAVDTGNDGVPADMIDSGISTLPPGAANIHQGPDSSRVEKETNET